MVGDDRNTEAPELLAHFLPRQVLQELHERARALQKDEQFRIYLLRRLWFVIPIVFISVLIGSACAIGTMFALHRFAPSPAPGWLVTVVFAAGALVWVASITAQLYVLLAWLHRRAFSQSHTSGFPPGAASLVLIVVFVAAPLVLFAFISPQIALILVAAGICAPVALSLLDRR
jgi:magnesium-transporting ATPase (P-type)